MFWNFIISAIVETALAITAQLLANRKSAKSTPASFSAPTSDQTIPVQVVFGTCVVQSQVMWWAEPTAISVRKGEAFGQFQRVGYTYHAMMGLGVCWGPIDALVDIVLDTTKRITDTASVPLWRSFPTTDEALPLALPGDGLPIDVGVHAEAAYGGADHDGGIAGTMRFFFGTTEQTQTFAFPLGTGDLPPYKRLCYAEFIDNGVEAPERPFYFGTSGTVKPIGFEVKRCPNLLGHGAMTNGLDANPIECIYECMVDTWWGLGMATSAFGSTWATAAATLQTEGLGVSKSVADANATVDVVIAEFLQEADASVYTDPVTGLIEIQLVRQDYDITTLTVVNDDGVTDVEYTRPTWLDVAASGVRIKFSNRAKLYADDIAEWQNPAALAAMNGPVTQEIDLPGITDATVAATLAVREARALTQPFASLSFKCDRRAYNFHKGKPFIYQDAAILGAVTAVFRVLSIDYGDLSDGTIAVTAAEDVFFSTGALAGTGGGSGSGSPVAPIPLVSAPDIVATTAETTTDDTVTLTVDDPFGLVNATHGVQWQTVVAGGTPSTLTDFVQSSSPYSVAITKLAVAQTFTFVVNYTDAYGNAESLTDSVIIPALAAPSRPQLNINVDGSGNVTVDWIGDPLTTGVKIAASKTGYPTATTTRAASLESGQTGTTGTLVTLAAGEVVYVTAFAYTSDAVPLESALAKATNNNTAPGTYIPLSQKGANSGVATLDSSGLVPTTQLPALAISQPFAVSSQAAMLALTAQRGDVAIRSDISETFILSTDSPSTLADWLEIVSPTGGVSSFNTRTGAVTPASGDYAVADVTGAAPLASPALTGVPTAPTATAGTNTTQLATTAFVTTAVAGGGGSSTPSAPLVSGETPGPAVMSDGIGQTITVPLGTAKVSSALTSYMGAGLMASRPAAPNVASGAIATYLATDTGKFFVWQGSSWSTSTN